MINGWRSVSALVAVAVAAHRVTDVLRWKKVENAQPTKNARVAVQSLNGEGALRAPINDVCRLVMFRRESLERVSSIKWCSPNM